MLYYRNTVQVIFIEFIKKYRMLRKFLYRLIFVHDMSTVNNLVIDWLEVSQQLIKDLI